MSYDVFLVDPDTDQIINLEEPHFMYGGTYSPGGTTELYLNITYNYGKILRRVLGPKGIFELHGMTGLSSTLVLEDAIGVLGDDVDENYWTATEGNVKVALTYLKVMANLGRNGIWRVA
jgi:hypothetical protein